MSRNTSQLKNAIHSLNIKKPFDLRAQMKPALKAPAQSEPAQIEQPQSAVVQSKPAQTEVAQIEQARSGSPAHQGFFMLAHSVFENPVTRNLSGDAFRIFIWMSSQAWRFRESNGQFRAAVDYIVVKCGCSRSTVTRALSDLKSAKLILCVEQNFKKGNLWQVSRIADGRNEHAEVEPAQKEKEAGSKSGGSMPKLSREHAQNEHHIITSQEINKNSEEGAAFQNELKGIWKKFEEMFTTDEDRGVELSKHLGNHPFNSNQGFARDLAVLKWWESLTKSPKNS